MIKCYCPGIVARYTVTLPPDVAGSGTRIAVTYVLFNDIWNLGCGNHWTGVT